MEKIESALDVLSRAATMVQPCPAYPASDSDSFGKFIFRYMCDFLDAPVHHYENNTYTEICLWLKFVNDRTRHNLSQVPFDIIVSIHLK